jgi:hypothetical protein
MYVGRLSRSCRPGPIVTFCTGSALVPLTTIMSARAGTTTLEGRAEPLPL